MVLMLLFSADEWNMNANFYLLLNFSLSPISVMYFFFFCTSEYLFVQ